LSVESLKGLLRCRVLDSELYRYIYSSDASMYEIEPLCIVLAESVNDVVDAVRFAYKHNIPVIARGGATGLVGQAIGEGIIIDMTSMNRVLEINIDKGYVTVEPGIYKGVLDDILKAYGKCIPVDPSSADYCTIGGMIANNASGIHTVKYGSTIDYVLSLEVVLSDGSIIDARRISIQEMNDPSNKSKEVEIARALYSILKGREDTISKGYPKVKKNSSGYRLDKVLCSDCIDLAKLFVASEGTLGIIVKARLKIIDIPRYKALALLAFNSTYDASLYVSSLYTSNISSTLRPSSIELIDKNVIRLANQRDIQNLDNDHDSIDTNVNSLLFVEFDGYSREEVESSLNELLAYTHRYGDGDGVRCLAYSSNTDEISKIWSIRKKALAYVMKMRKDKAKALAFIEDPVVDVNRLADLVRGIEGIYAKHGVEHYTIYGHAADGNLHTRPMIDLSKDYREEMYSLAMDMLTLVRGMNGSISAEHGDGIARREFVRLLYGDEIYNLFVAVKMLLDPRNIMNPGKKISIEYSNDNNSKDDGTRRIHSLTEHMRIFNESNETELNWGMESPRIIEAITSYPYTLTYGDEVSLCHGCGMCRELSYRVRMCPVYKGLQREEASCRGRNNMLRWLSQLSSIASKHLFTDDYKDIIYRYCIQCKMCLVDCPSNVDVGKIMAEARARYAAVKGLPKGYRYFAEIDRYAYLACRLSPLSNRLIGNRLFRLVLEHITGIDSKKHIPQFSSVTFDRLFSDYRQGDYDKQVALFADTYIRYINPSLGLKIVKILNLNGYMVEYPRQLSSGLPALLEGAVETGKRIAMYNIDNLYYYASKGIPIVTFSPSASLALRMEYLNVIDDERSRLVADNVYDIHELLNMLNNNGELMEFNSVDEDILLHMHCHTIVQGYDRDVIELLRRIPSLRVSLLERGCCGVGGSYSFIKGNYELSMLIGKELFHSVSEAFKDKRYVYTTGESCMLQMMEGTRYHGYNHEPRIGLTVELISRAYNIT
jgi:FAD/FMN-containing dehydrogenase/Fe-S oxidoreductase